MGSEEIIELINYREGRRVTDRYSVPGAIRQLEILAHNLPPEVALATLRQLISELGDRPEVLQTLVPQDHLSVLKG